jgi:hypothetical protein
MRSNTLPEPPHGLLACFGGRNSLLARTQETIGREINLTVYTVDECAKKRVGIFRPLYSKHFVHGTAVGPGKWLRRSRRLGVFEQT